MAKSIKPNQPSIINTPDTPEEPKVDFSKYHVHFGIPCYGGQITEPCFTLSPIFTNTALTTPP